MKFGLALTAKELAIKLGGVERLLAPGGDFVYFIWSRHFHFHLLIDAGARMDSRETHLVEHASKFAR
jgi:hypothetical protein